MSRASDLIAAVAGGTQPVQVLSEMAAAVTGLGGYHGPATAEYLIAIGHPPFVAFRANRAFYANARAKGFRGAGGTSKKGEWTYWMPFYGGKKFGIKIVPGNWPTEDKANADARSALAKAKRRFNPGKLAQFIRSIERRSTFSVASADRDMEAFFGPAYRGLDRDTAVANAKGEDSPQQPTPSLAKPEVPVDAPATGGSRVAGGPVPWDEAVGPIKSALASTAGIKYKRGRGGTMTVIIPDIQAEDVTRRLQAAGIYLAHKQDNDYLVVSADYAKPKPVTLPRAASPAPASHERGGKTLAKLRKDPRIDDIEWEGDQYWVNLNLAFATDGGHGQQSFGERTLAGVIEFLKTVAPIPAEDEPAPAPEKTVETTTHTYGNAKGTWKISLGSEVEIMQYGKPVWTGTVSNIGKRQITVRNSSGSPRMFNRRNGHSLDRVYAHRWIRPTDQRPQDKAPPTEDKPAPADPRPYGVDDFMKDFAEPKALVKIPAGVTPRLRVKLTTSTWPEGAPITKKISRSSPTNRKLKAGCWAIFAQGNRGGHMVYILEPTSGEWWWLADSDQREDLAKAVAHLDSSGAVQYIFGLDDEDVAEPETPAPAPAPKAAPPAELPALTDADIEIDASPNADGLYVARDKRTKEPLTGYTSDKVQGLRQDDGGWYRDDLKDGAASDWRMTRAAAETSLKRMLVGGAEMRQKLAKRSPDKAMPKAATPGPSAPTSTRLKETTGRTEVEALGRSLTSKSYVVWRALVQAIKAAGWDRAKVGAIFDLVPDDWTQGRTRALLGGFIKSRDIDMSMAAVRAGRGDDVWFTTKGLTAAKAYGSGSASPAPRTAAPRPTKSTVATPRSSAAAEGAPPILMAQQYQRKGWPVFPIKARTKADIPIKWGSEAQVNSSALSEWNRAYPHANVGLRTDKLVVIDIDAPGLSAWQQLVDRYGEPDTATVKTGSGGLHVYFLAPSGTDWSNSPGGFPGGIDVRAGKGGYVVAPPSIHPNGTRYEFVKPLARIKPLPAWIQTILKAKTTDRSRSAPDRGALRALAKEMTLLSRLMQFTGEPRGKAAAYARMADFIAQGRVSAETIAGGKEALRAVDGIGKALSDKTIEFMETGRIAKVAQLSITVGADTVDMLREFTPFVTKKLVAAGVQSLADVREISAAQMKAIGKVPARKVQEWLGGAGAGEPSQSEIERAVNDAMQAGFPNSQVVDAVMKMTLKTDDAGVRAKVEAYHQKVS